MSGGFFPMPTLDSGGRRALILQSEQISITTPCCQAETSKHIVKYRVIKYGILSIPKQDDILWIFESQTKEFTHGFGCQKSLKSFFRQLDFFLSLSCTCKLTCTYFLCKHCHLLVAKILIPFLWKNKSVSTVSWKQCNYNVVCVVCV